MISSILLAGLARVSIFQWMFTEDKSEIRTLGSEWCHWDKFKGPIDLKETTLGLGLGHQVNNDEDLTNLKLLVLKQWWHNLSRKLF